jgi:hypothetical protein
LAVQPPDSLRFDIVDHVLVVVHADVVPDVNDWARMITVRDANRLRIRGGLVVAPPRANINAQQRADVARFMKETGACTAVMTDSALIRGVAAAVGLLGLKVRAFRPSDLNGALDYLNVPAGKRVEFQRRVAALSAQLDGSPARTSSSSP